MSKAKLPVLSSKTVSFLYIFVFEEKKQCAKRKKPLLVRFL